MLARERRPVPAGYLPRPMPLPSLSGALAGRAAIFGPQQLDTDGFLEPMPEVAPSGFWRTLEQAARDAVATITGHRADRPSA